MRALLQPDRGGRSAAICRDPRRDAGDASASSRKRRTSARSSGPGEFRGLLSRARRPALAARRRRPGRSHRSASSSSASRGGEVREVILATNPSLEGEATALYVQRQLAGDAGVACHAHRARAAGRRRSRVRRRRDHRAGAVRAPGRCEAVDRDEKCAQRRASRRRLSSAASLAGGASSGARRCTARRRELFSRRPCAPARRARLPCAARPSAGYGAAPARLPSLGAARPLLRRARERAAASGCSAHLDYDQGLTHGRRRGKLVVHRRRLRRDHRIAAALSLRQQRALRAARRPQRAARRDGRRAARPSTRRRSRRSPRPTSAPTTSSRG